jgi:hypothetical protein
VYAGLVIDLSDQWPLRRERGFQRPLVVSSCGR